jgi:hypothetical protein
MPKAERLLLRLSLADEETVIWPHPSSKVEAERRQRLTPDEPNPAEQNSSSRGGLYRPNSLANSGLQKFQARQGGLDGDPRTLDCFASLAMTVISNLRTML